MAHPGARANRLKTRFSPLLLATLATLATLLGLTLAAVEQYIPEFTLLCAVPRFNKAVLSFCARVLLCRNNAPVLIHYKIGPNELAVGFVRGPHPHLLSGSDQVSVGFTVHVIQTVGTPIYALHFIVCLFGCWAIIIINNKIIFY